MMIRPINFAVLLSCLIFIYIADVRAQQIYSWTDENGVRHFSTVNAPPQAVETATKKYEAGRDFTNSLGMKFILIKPSTFYMGSPSREPDHDDKIETRHKVTLTRSYQIQATEVTQKQWKAVMGDNPSFHKGDDYPVERVSMSMIQEFLRKLNALDPEGNYRLPTEAEWEYACRAGSQTAFSSGVLTAKFCDPDQNLNAVGWYCGNSNAESHPVAQKIPNAWGLYDMHGNLYEFCSDYYAGYPAGHVKDPQGPSSSSAFTIRGGCFQSDAVHCRSASRVSIMLSRRSPAFGFRLARTVPVPGQARESDRSNGYSTAYLPESRRPAKAPRTHVNQFGMRFIYVSPGTFLMGSDVDKSGNRWNERQRQVRLTRGYYLQETEMTSGHLMDVMGPQGSEHGHCKDGMCPVTNISWHDVQEMINKLNSSGGPGRYRLPTEAEWEYACRAGSTTPFANGYLESLGDIGWYFANSDDMLHPVAQKAPNAWGFCDMHGNVWEWCQDFLHDIRSPEPAVDPVELKPESKRVKRVIKGGSYQDDFGPCRSSSRSGMRPERRGDTVGLRLVYEP